MRRDCVYFKAIKTLKRTRESSRTGQLISTSQIWWELCQSIPSRLFLERMTNTETTKITDKEPTETTVINKKPAPNNIFSDTESDEKKNSPK